MGERREGIATGIVVVMVLPLLQVMVCSNLGIAQECHIKYINDNRENLWLARQGKSQGMLP